MGNRFKFRVWDEPNKKMIYDVLNDLRYYLSYDVFEVMQSTGLKDKNGKLIYENDIVKTLYTKPNGEVINRNCIIEYNRGAFWINYGIGASYLDNDDCTYEIIGNVFQDKDLLNE